MNDGLHTDPGVAPDAGSASALIAGIVQDAQKLISQQIELVKQEIKDDIRQLAYAVAMVSVGAGFCAISLILLCFMGVYVLHEVAGLQLWLSYLIAGVTFLALGGLLLFLAVHRLTTHNPLPDQTLEGLKENLTWKTNPK
jgi:hypothetical protein